MGVAPSLWPISGSYSLLSMPLEFSRDLRGRLVLTNEAPLGLPKTEGVDYTDLLFHLILPRSLTVLWSRHQALNQLSRRCRFGPLVPGHRDIRQGGTRLPCPPVDPGSGSGGGEETGQISPSCVLAITGTGSCKNKKPTFHGFRGCSLPKQTNLAEPSNTPTLQQSSSSSPFDLSLSLTHTHAPRGNPR